MSVSSAAAPISRCRKLFLMVVVAIAAAHAKREPEAEGCAARPGRNIPIVPSVSYCNPIRDRSSYGMPIGAEERKRKELKRGNDEQDRRLAGNAGADGADDARVDRIDARLRHRTPDRRNER